MKINSTAGGARIIGRIIVRYRAQRNPVQPCVKLKSNCPHWEEKENA